MIKKTLSFFMIVTMLLISINSKSVNAHNENYDSQYIKVGISRKVPAKESIKLAGEGFTVGIESGNISELFKINTQDIVAKSKKFGYHIELSDSFISYDKASSKAKELSSQGIDSYVSYEQGFKVWIGEFTSEVLAKQFLANNPRLSGSAKVSKNLLMTSIENLKNEKLISFDRNQKIYIKSSGGITKIEGTRYRGYAGFINNQNKLTTINYVQIGDYLKGVVPREMSASWEIEALKAQAVSARNYALRDLDKHKSLGYDLCDSTNCQVYDGYDIEHANTNRAIEETRDKVLSYNGDIAQTFYYSCSGGYTVSNEDAWNGTPIPYLRGKKDPYSLNTPQTNWTYTISKADAAKKLKASGFDVGQIISLQTKRDGLGARVLELKVVGTNGTKSVPKEKIRDVFGYSNVKSTNYRIDGSIDEIPTLPPVIPTEPIQPIIKNDIYMLSGNNNIPKKDSINGVSVMTAEGIKKVDSKSQKIVMSNGTKKVVINTHKPNIQKPVVANVTNVVSLVSTPSISNNVGNTITFKGSGWGHGVGMSQYGALNMAKEGHDFREILEFYFTGAKVE